ncbi:HDOD domain-containing protein [Desulfococcus sp.]|uniref:sensor domain-containing diguanylate cyclase n=1 Tax=Desulfococcus sp. TaxID=2025834 RepID=UPI003592F9D9
MAGIPPQSSIGDGRREKGTQMLNDRLIKTIASKIDQLPTLPGIAMKLLDAVRKKEPDIGEIDRIISSDAVLTTKILKLANSPFYGFKFKITTIQRAISMLGLNTIKSLALSFSVTTTYYNKNVKGINYTQFWKDSIVGAVSAKLLAEKISPALSADAFFMGLLKDMGALTLAYGLPEAYAQVVSAVEDGESLHEAETRVLGFNHMEMGEYLANSWGLPENFCIPIGCHHFPEKVADPQIEDIVTRSRLLHLASLFTELLNASEMVFLLGSLQQLTQAYGFSGNLDCARMAEEINTQTREILPIFDIQFKDDRDLSQLLEKAKSELANLSLELITSLAAKDKEVEFFREQATLDGLTAISNYKGFCEGLDREMSRAQRYKKPLSLIFSDIDHFKKVNDTYGHLAGDEALKTVVLRMKKELRQSDYIARYGGEEFAVILPETDSDDAMWVAERLRKKIEIESVSYQEARFSVTMSFGVASLLMGQSLSREGFIKLADDALYQAKKAGRNRCCLSE